MYVKCDAGQHNDYVTLKHTLETKLKEAVRLIRTHEHKGFDVGFILFADNKSVLSCCVNEMDLWIGLYDKETKSIQRYIIFNDIKELTDAQINRFVSVIENIAKNPKRMLKANNIAEAWEKELREMGISLQ